MTVTEVLPDAGLCRWCPHGQWSHKRGKGGCRELDCTCDKYAVDPVAQQAEQERVLTVVAEVCEGQAAKARTELAEIRGEVVEGPDGPDLGVCVGGFEPAQPGDVDLPAPVDEPAPAAAEPDVHECGWSELAELAIAYVNEPDGSDNIGPIYCEMEAAVQHRQAMGGQGPQVRGPLAAEVDRLTAERDEAGRICGEAGIEIDRLRAERDEARRLADLNAKDQAATAANLDETRRAHAAELGRLRDELTVELDESQFQRGIALNALRRAGAKQKVLFQYDARQCTTKGCGSRYTVDVDHEHPLTPVTVMVVAREVPDA